MKKSEKVALQKKILEWYKKHKRDLPWRNTKDPYRILVSEVMLQQTQVSRVLPKYKEWLTKFPTIEVLANASTTDVLKVWIGLGYNRRALYLKKAAQEVVYRGRWPTTEKELMSLPGIGKYTSRALLCFAFGKQVAVVDTNVRKVILVEVFKKSASTKEVEAIAEELVPEGKAYDWNQALMDYASFVLREQKVPIPRQSKYLGSDRYYRAKIIKLLLQKKRIVKKELGLMLRDDYTDTLIPWLEKLLSGMEKHELIKQDVKNIYLFD